MRNILRTVAFAGTLSSAFYPQTLQAQSYDTWTLNREVLNSAANYTSVLTTAHREVRKYITWDWSTSLDEDAQQTRTEALLFEINYSQQVTADLVPSLKIDVLDSYDVRFRYCDNMLLSYFDGTSFKHGLSAQQIIAAPVLRAQRTATSFYGEQLGRVVDDPTRGELMLQTNGDSTPIPTCMGDDYSGALPEGTVAYMTSAVRKLGSREELSPRTETRDGVCPATHPLGTVDEARAVERSWRFPDSEHLQDFPALREAVKDDAGAWETTEDECYRNVNELTTETRNSNCPYGKSGFIYYKREMTVTGVDWHTRTDQLRRTPWTGWVETQRICYTPSPPPRPTPTSSGCTGNGKGYDMCRNIQHEKNARSSGGDRGGEGGHHDSDDGHPGHGEHGSGAYGGCGCNKG